MYVKGSLFGLHCICSREHNNCSAYSSCLQFQNLPSHERTPVVAIPTLDCSKARLLFPCDLHLHQAGNTLQKLVGRLQGLCSQLENDVEAKRSELRTLRGEANATAVLLP